ncbi:MAG: SH3 domain-containing protein [Syntrophales bacterium]|nr:SH3 domain-containing protein [Syntrophales bacterium]
MSVQVREGQIRATPSHLGSVVARAFYGDMVALLEERGDWRKVSLRDGKLQGWMHSTALTSKRIILSSGEADVKTSVVRGEIALAGKGFSEEIEDEYREANKDLDYTWVNRMEEAGTDPEQMRAFLAAGALSPRLEGGRP